MTVLREQLQLMHMGRQLLQVELAEIAARHGLDPIAAAEDSGAAVTTEEEEAYYLQYAAELRRQAQSMAQYYRIFFCLENSIRELVESQLLDAYGENWWDEHVPERVRDSVALNVQRERDNGVTLRSERQLTIQLSGNSAKSLSVISTFLELRSTVERVWRGSCRLSTSCGDLSRTAPCWPKTKWPASTSPFGASTD